MKYHQRTTQITVLPAGEALYSTRAIVISIVDDAGGEYVSVKTNLDISVGVSDQEITIDPEEWPAIRDVIDRMMAEISDWQEITNDTNQ